MFRSRLERRTTAIVATAVGLIASMLIITGAEAGPGTVSVVDYAQCANQKPGGPEVTAPGASAPSEFDCYPQGWINGILQGSNSHYKEDQVTPQRLQVLAQPGVAHSITLRYMARKGNTHAYDYLDTWNATSVDADRCQGLVASAKVGIGCDGSAPSESSSLTIAIDSEQIRDDLGSGADHATDGHGVVPGKLYMYGGTLTGMTTPKHDNAGGVGDDYATTVISYTISGNKAKNVQLVFGGHLASPDDWGSGHGAASISGGPYHIKWDAADGASVGNRDNQIQGSAIVPLRNTTVPTAASATTIGGNLSDKAWLPGVTTDAGGTITFKVFSSVADCQGALATPPTATALHTSAPVPVTTVSVPVLGTPTDFRGATYTWTNATGAGTYVWFASYSGDSKNNPANGDCTDANEAVTVAPATPSYTTTASSAAALVVGTPGTVSDSASFTGGYNVTGTMTWHLYFDATSTMQCTTANEVALTTSTSSVSANSASIGPINVTPPSPGTYYFTSSYGGDSNNSANSTSGTCGATGESVSVAQASNTGSTVVKLADTVTVNGYRPTGNVTFTLYGPFTTEAEIACSGSAALTSIVALPSGTDNSKSISTTDNTDSTKRYYSAAEGYYGWKVTYAGDTNNAGGTVSACGAERAHVTYPT